MIHMLTLACTVICVQKGVRGSSISKVDEYAEKAAQKEVLVLDEKARLDMKKATADYNEELTAQNKADEIEGRIFHEASLQKAPLSTEKEVHDELRQVFQVLPTEFKQVSQRANLMGT